MKRSPFLVVGIVVAWLCANSPAWANGGSCMFQAKGLTLSFGALDPSSGSNVTVAMSPSTANANKAGDCQPTNSTLTLSADNGLNFSGSRRLKNNASADFIRYSLTGVPVTSARPGNGTYTTFTISGTILATDYQDARVGTYSDTVIVTVSP